MTSTKPKVKICGLKTAADVQACLSCAADFIGLVFYAPSPRAVTPQQAKEALAPLTQTPVNKRPKITGLFVNPSDNALREILAEIDLDLIQLHGDETPERCGLIRGLFNTPVMKAIPVAVKQDLIDLEPYEKNCDWILFDTKSSDPAIKGGSGHSFDWSLLQGIRHTKPWMLAGGLTADNITGALSILSPDALDVSSGVEREKGVKDHAKIKDFITAVR